MYWTDEMMRRALRRLKPETVKELARGPLGGDDCRTCQVLLPMHLQMTEAGHGERYAAITLLMYHDEPTFDPDLSMDYAEDPWGDYYYGSGIGCVVTYGRCLRIYAAARALVASPVVL